MQKKLSEILEPASIQVDSLFKDTIITGLAFDSRAVKSGFLFFALPGIHVNGNAFILSALKNGANCVVYQGDLPQDLNIQDWQKVAFVKVEDSRFVMASISDAFYDFPSKKLKILGVTGTEGKSTTVFFLWQLLRLCGKKSGFISTVEYSLGDEAIKNPEHQTTPEAPIINEKLYQMIQNNCEYAVIESSSHGLSPKTNRLGSILFDAVAFMNVTHEHLEFHGTYQQYKNDKANLFRALDKNLHVKNGEKISPIGAVNLQDKASEYFATATTKNVVGFTAQENVFVPSCIKKVLFAQNILSDKDGSNFDLCILERTTQNNSLKNDFATKKTLPVRIEVPGAFNVYNVLATIILVAGILQKDESELIELLPKLKPVRGRMSTINQGQNFEVIIDYAHTPSSFEAIFPSLRKRAKGKIISLFGSGGERDTQKRPIQGEIASKYSDIVILADEDPRGEEPIELLEDIAKGCKNLKRDESLFLIPDRKDAIKKAFSLAKENDIVLLLGKGHENSIIYKDFVMPYDEIQQAKQTLTEMGF